MTFQITHTLLNSQKYVLGAVSFSIALEIVVVTKTKFWWVSRDTPSYNVN